MSPRKTANKETEVADVNVDKVEQGIVDFCILGRSTLLCNAMSEKAKQQLIFPEKKNNFEKETIMKHEPWEEYRNSPYRNRLSNAPTRLQALGSWFKKSMMVMALDQPGLRKAQVGRMVYVLDDRIDLYGIPEISCMIVRNSDQNHTPDIRIRAALRRWACKIAVEYTLPRFNGEIVAKLLGNAGHSTGVGDGRRERGWANFGQFQIVPPNDPEFLSVFEEGREAQDLALANPAYYDEDTRELLEWFEAERTRRSRNKKPHHREEVTGIAAD